MDTNWLRSIFANFLKEEGVEGYIVCEYSSTISTEPNLKYERVDKYRILFIGTNQLEKLMQFCKKHEIVVWLGADKLCIGYNHLPNMRLSAYSSVRDPAELPERDPDRIELDLGIEAPAVILPSMEVPHGRM